MNDVIHRDHENRISRLEGAIENIDKSLMEIKSDIRELRKDARGNFLWLLTIMLGGFSGLFGLIAHVAKWF